MILVGIKLTDFVRLNIYRFSRSFAFFINARYHSTFRPLYRSSLIIDLLKNLNTRLFKHLNQMYKDTVLLLTIAANLLVFLSYFIIKLLRWSVGLTQRIVVRVSKTTSSQNYGHHFWTRLTQMRLINQFLM